jgi:hypothetical protein
VPGRYSFVSASELGAGLSRMRAEAKLNGHRWIDPRPTHITAASEMTPPPFGT